MESEGDNSDGTSSSCTPSTTKTTNWIIAGGSIDNSVTFESSIDEDNGIHDDRRSSPLILRPPSHDSSPCEITIAVKKKHELRQIYVRSTARVYEIYYASDLSGSNDYLCTVRCGKATRDDDVLSVPEVEVADSASSKRPTEKVDERNLKAKNPSSTNEDGWVEVKIPDNSHGQGTKKTLQDFYEATAEISDTDPCASLTIRLLSLQSKDCVCIDEIYVFADPVDPVETKSQVSETQNLGGSSLMAMLVPTFLQLSKAQGKQTLERVGEHRFNETGLKSTETTIVSEIQQDPKSSSVYQQEDVKATSESRQPEIPQQNSNTEIKPDSSLNRVEKVLEQLVSRVSRVEDFMLRFEERMLKPINSIDARLQQVEQQVEGLARKFQSSGVPSCVRISAPDFSCCESTENSFYHDGADDHNLGACRNDEQDHNVGASEKDGQEFSSASPSDDTVDLEIATQPIPGLRVTAPEFSNAEEEDENHEPEPVSDSPNDKPRRLYSIDDALASALSGFLSSTLDSRKYSQALAVKAPDFSNEDSDKDKKNSAEAEPEITSCPVLDETVCVQDSDNMFSEREESVNTYLNTEDTEIPDNKILEAYVEEDGSLGNKMENVDSPVTRDLGLHNDAEDLESCNRSSVILGDSEIDNPKHETTIQVDDSFDACREEFINCDSIAEANLQKMVEIVRKQETEKEIEKSILQDVLRFSSLSQAVNFETPILDVKFTSEEYPETKSSLEALLGGMSESNIEKSDLAESFDGLATHEQQDNLISLADNEPTGSTTGIDISFDVDYNYCSVLTIGMEDPKLLENHMCNQETTVASLI